MFSGQMLQHVTSSHVQDFDLLDIFALHILQMALLASVSSMSNNDHAKLLKLSFDIASSENYSETKVAIAMTLNLRGQLELVRHQLHN